MLKAIGNEVKEIGIHIDETCAFMAKELIL